MMKMAPKRPMADTITLRSSSVRVSSVKEKAHYQNNSRQNLSGNGNSTKQTDPGRARQPIQARRHACHRHSPLIDNPVPRACPPYIPPLTHPRCTPDLPCFGKVLCLRTHQKTGSLPFQRSSWIKGSLRWWCGSRASPRQVSRRQREVAATGLRDHGQRGPGRWRLVGPRSVQRECGWSYIRCECCLLRCCVLAGCNRCNPGPVLPHPGIRKISTSASRTSLVS